MLKLWQKTVNLLKGHPTLWLPVICVSLTDFYLEWLQKIVVRGVVNWLLTAHSALGFTFQPSDPNYSYFKRATFLSLPLSLGIRLLILCVYIAGFLITARLVHSLLQDQRPHLATAAIFLRSRLWQILLFSLKLFALFVLAALSSSGLLNLSAFAFLRGDLSFPVLITLVFILVCICIAWILTPASIRLISDRQSESIPPEEKAQGRIAAMIVATVCVVIYYFVSTATPSINSRFESDVWLRSLVIWPTITVLGNLPLALLWVFFARLAYEDVQLPEIPSPS